MTPLATHFDDRFDFHANASLGQKLQVQKFMAKFSIISLVGKLRRPFNWPVPHYHYSLFGPVVLPIGDREQDALGRLHQIHHLA